MVKVGLDAVLPGLGHSLDARLRLLAPPLAITVEAVSTVKTVKTVSQGVT